MMTLEEALELVLDIARGEVDQCRKFGLDFELLQQAIDVADDFITNNLNLPAEYCTHESHGPLKIMGFLNESNEHAYIYADSLVVAIGRTDEGVVADIWDSDFNEVLNSMYSYFIDGHAYQEEGELL